MLSKFLKQCWQLRSSGASFSQLKYYTHWHRSQSHGNSIEDRLPWITYDAISYLKKNLKSEHRVFEFGGGGSTLFFLDRVATVNTVEHDAKWFEILTEVVAKVNNRKWRGELIAAESNVESSANDTANPEHYVSDDVKFKSMHFTKYAQSILNYDDETFDAVLVDGRARPSCIACSLQKIKLGGLLILDNSDRKYYLKQTEVLINTMFQKVVYRTCPSPYTKDFTQTTIWKRVH